MPLLLNIATITMILNIYQLAGISDNFRNEKAPPYLTMTTIFHNRWDSNKERNPKKSLTTKRNIEKSVIFRQIRDILNQFFKNKFRTLHPLTIKKKS